MRIFGKMSHFLQISRCLSYHAPICRPHRLLHGSCKQWKKICTNCVCWQPPLLMEIHPQMPIRIHVQLFSTKTTNVFTFNSTSDMLRKRISFSGTQGEEDGNANILPVGIIVPEKADGPNMKIVIVPLDLINQDSESIKNTLNVINELRNHAKEIDLFTNSIIQDFRKSANKKKETTAVEEPEKTKNIDNIHLWDTFTTKDVDAVATATATESNPNEVELQAAVAALATDLAHSTQADVAPMIPAPCTPNLQPNAPGTVPAKPNTVPSTTPQTQPGALPLADPMEPQISATPKKEVGAPEAAATIEPEIEAQAPAQGQAQAEAQVQNFSIDVPKELGQHLSEMAISSMQLSFEMNVTNVRDAILYGDNAAMNDSQELGSDPMVFLETNVKVDPAHEAEITVPLKFNALIQGTVDIDAEKINPDNLTHENLPNYNDAITSMAANICSTALQQGFSTNKVENPSDAKTPQKSFAHARMALKRHQAQQAINVEQKRPIAMVQSAVAEPSLKDGCKHPIIKKKKKCPKPCKLDDPCEEDKCKRPHKKIVKPTKITKKPKNSSVQAKITASAGKCGKKNAKGGSAGKKKDPCAKSKDGKDGKDKKDPCAKFKKGKDAKGGKDGKDKKDPCAKFKGKDAKGGKDGKDKKDPCAKFKKAKDGKGGKDAKCGKGGKGGKDGKDKKDPCAKFKKPKDGKGGKDAKCGKGGKGGKDGKDKKDPCAKFKKPKDGKGGKGGKDGKDKKDPCAKFKKGKDGKGGKSGKGKKDPCAKFKKGKDGKGGKDGKDKKDPCAKFKKGKNGAKGGKNEKKDPCKKKFSTLSKFYRPGHSLWNPKRQLSTALNNYTKVFKEQARSNSEIESSTCKCRATPARFTVYSTLVRRHYSGNPSKMQMSAWGFNSKRSSSNKDEGKTTKCNELVPKGPKRVHPKQRTGLRTDCHEKFTAECPKNYCKGTCGKVKFPKKKCDKKKKKPKVAVSKPKKKMPAICMQGKKGKDSKERNKLFDKGPLIFFSQIRMQCDTSHSRKRYVSQAIMEKCLPNETDEPSRTIEIVKIPASYHICKELRTRPRLKKYDVLIRTGSIALTGSDIHVYENANRDIEGITLGHDATGFIEEIGSCVQNLHVGDRVVMESALSCGICEYCKQGLYNICSDLVYNGFLASHQTHPADLCHRLPDTVSMEEGTLTQTLAMGCQACFKANITPTSNVLIIGSTPTSVSAAMCAAAIGAKKVIIASTMSSSLEMINQDFGFKIIHFDPSALFGEVLEAIFKHFDEWPNCAINCAISPMTMNLAVMALQPCSVCVLSECECECASFNALDVLMKNIRIIPSFRSANMFPTALTLMKSGHAPMHKFIANTYPWSMLEQAFKCAQHESNTGLRKIVVNSTEGINIGRLFKKKVADYAV